MLRLPVLRHAAPTTLDEAIELLAAEGTMLAAGGTDLVPNLKRRQYPEAKTIVSLRRIPELRGIDLLDDGSLRIGALTTLAELVADDRAAPALREAARAVASPQLRSRGTVGGNLCVDTRCHWLNVPETWRRAAEPCLKAGGDTCWVAPAKRFCWAVSSTDLAPMAIALDATVELAGPEGRRRIPLEELYRNDGMAHLTKAPDEILVALVVPPLGDRRAGYRKLRRRGSIDFPILGVAARLGFDGEVCTDARLVVGAIVSAPLRLPQVEALLEGRPLDAATIRAAAEAAGKAVRPMSNTDLTSRYRKRMVPVFVRRLLDELVGASGATATS
ncbi:MAG TPA: 4-hydroxybenzoyl-CoA reductase [Actinobacteria bacterium]|nr:4-hydroxybenzoyl-CoA reductase [Actinomycetota bacterium]